jgi:hypothetical protein
MWKCWKFGSVRRASARSRQVRPCLEALEDRLCPAPLMVTTLNDPASPQANDGSLRGELLQNVMDGGGDTIQFAAGLNGTIFLNYANGPLSNGGKSVTIANPNGDNITVSGQGAVEDLKLSGGTGVNVSISGQSAGGAGSLTFTRGLVSTTTGIAEGGGIFNSATTVLNNVAITNSTAVSSNSVGLGGGIYNKGALTLNDASVTGNTASSSASFADGQGGGIFNDNPGTLAAFGSVIADNTANAPGSIGEGGGIFDGGTGLSLTGTVVSGNQAQATSGDGKGGGIYISADTHVTLSDATVSANLASGQEAFGGGIYAANGAQGTLSNVTVSGNTADANSDLDAFGGGIYNSNATLTFSGNVVGNTAFCTTGDASGGGIFNSDGGNLNIGANGSSATIIDANAAEGVTFAAGGGIYNTGSGSVITITTADIIGNTTSTPAGGRFGAEGGGIFNSHGSTISLNASTVANNAVSASGNPAQGGGIYNDAALTATNDTIWNNSVTANGSGSKAFGGGIYTSAGTTTLINVTVGDNTATSDTSAKGGGIYQSNTATLNLVNSIVSDPNGPAGSPDVFGTVANAQNDDFASTTGLTITHDLGGNLLNVVPLLGPLGNNGGPTQTVAELAGSGSIDAGVANAGVNAVFGTNPIPDIDQRGAARPDVPGSNPDIGAFEFYPPAPPPTPTHTSAPTTITGLSVSDSFGAFNQTETVKGQVVAGGMPVSGGTVTVSDGGETQTVGVNSSGDFSATFVFNLFQEFSTAAAHSISVSYGGATVGSTTFGSSSGSVGAPNNSLSFLFELLLLEDILAAIGMG